MSRKVSIESTGDAHADDLLHAAYDLAFRRRSIWGWLLAAAFAAVPAWISVLCWFDDNILCGVVFAVVALLIIALRGLCLVRAKPSPSLRTR